MMIVRVITLFLYLRSVFSLAFQLPNFRMPWENTKPKVANDDSSNLLKPGDTIAVVGASGNVGKLVALRLSDTYRVNGIVRDISSSLADFFKGRDIKLFESDIVKELDCLSLGTCPESLHAALENANAIVVCTGTT